MRAQMNQIQSVEVWPCRAEQRGNKKGGWDAGLWVSRMEWMVFFRVTVCLVFPPDYHSSPPFPSPLPSLLLSSPHPDSPSIPGISCGESWKTKQKKKSQCGQRGVWGPAADPPLELETREVRSDQQHVFSIFHQFSFDVEHFILFYFFGFVCSDNFVKNFLKKKKWKTEEKARSLSKFIDDIRLYARRTE